MEDKNLMNSHIIPEFIYKPLYSEKHTFHVLSTHEEGRRPIEQKGIRERLLCDDCEQRLSRYESYGKKILFGGIPLDCKKEDGGFILSGIDYNIFKLFQLSILWRASVSTHPMFKNVTLGSHEMKIRKMILDNDPGEEDKYCCAMVAIKSGNDLFDGFIEQPEKRRIDHHIVYRFIFGSIAWIYFVSSHNVPVVIHDFILSKDGRLRMAVKDIKDLNCIVEFAKDLYRMNRFPKEPYP